MKKFSLLAATLGLIMALVSCNTGGNDAHLTSTQSFTQCYAVVTNTDINTPYTVDVPVTVSLKVDYYALTCEVTFSGLKKPDGTPYPAFTIKDVKWKANETNWGVATAAAPEVTTANSLPVVISDFKFNWHNREYFSQATGGSYTTCNFSFTLDGVGVVGSRREVIIAGKTVSSSPSSKPFESMKPVYTLLLDFDKRTADLKITNAKFEQNMPAMTMVFPAIPFTVERGGNVITFSAAALTPTIAGTPYPNFPITEFKGTLTPTSGIDLSFICGFKGTPYTVTSTLVYEAVPDMTN